MNAPPNREVALFSAALELPASEHAAYLAEACADDPALCLRLEALLRVHEEAIPFLETPPPGAQDSAMGAEVPVATACLPSSPAEKAGDRIGRYKLLQQIGEGGCGVVYMAEQEEPVRRRVALKVIKLGMETKQVVARFEAERQALALMDHPNIAKVFDAGTTETGRPYFVMELVRGTKITDYCDQNQLSTEDRLKLFTQVCQAIQHAHQKGIIHRDIKPSNILVTISEPGAPGCPKVIDFGIAKATTGQRLTDMTVFTAFEQFIGTPAYMSPEQAMMTSLDIDTRTDIYALGVLLYELLTGQTPFDAKDLMAAGLDAMRRIIREQEPVRPSTRLSTLLAADLTTVARHRQCPAPKLLGLIRGDLDWIVMKALEKDRTRRYETANGLAMDIQRHLNCEPVVACPPSRLYEFQKTVRRHKFGFAAAAAIITVLAVGVLVSTSEAIRAARAERDQSRLRQNAVASQKQSQTEAAKATAISDFLQQLLRSANPDALKGSEYTVRQLLDDFSAGLEKQLAGQPEVEATVRATIGNAYFRLGVADKAEQHLERALALRRHLYGEQSEEVAQSLVDHAWNLPGTAAEAEARRALDIYRRRGTDAQPVIHALCVLGVILNFQQRFHEVETISEEALALARNSPKRDFPEIANIMHNLADTKVSQAKYVEAEKLALQAVEMHRRLHGSEHPETAWSLLMLGRALAGQHKLAEAQRAYQEALGIFRRYYPFQHSIVQLAVGELRAVLETKGDSAAVEALYREGLAGQRAALGNDNLAVAQALSGLAASLYAQGKQTEARIASRAAMGIILNLRDQGRAQLPSGVRELAEVLKAQGNSQDAEKLFEDAIDFVHQRMGETNRIVTQLIHDYGDFLAREGKLKAAVEYVLNSLPILRAQQDDNLVWTLEDLGGALISIGRPREAEAYFRESLALYRNLHKQENVGGTAWLCLRLGDALYQQHKLPEAEQSYRDALAIYRKCQALGSDDCARAIRSLLEVLREENKLADGEVLCRDLLAQLRTAFTNDNPAVARTLVSLATILQAAGKRTEAGPLFRDVAEHADAQTLNGLAWQLATGPDPKLRDGPGAITLAEKAVAATNRKQARYLDTLAAAYAVTGQFTNAVCVQQEAIALLQNEQEKQDYALRLKLYQNSLPYRDHGPLSELTRARLIEGKFTEAEELARECLAIREKEIPDDWRTFNARSMLGGSLLGQKKYAEAEPLLLSGYAGMRQREDKIPQQGKPHLKETLRRLVQLYEATSRPDQAAEWKQKLVAYDKTKN